MRLNSIQGAKYLKVVYVLCICILVFDLVILNVDGSFGNLGVLSPVAIFLLLFSWYRGLPNMIYDSEGEVLNLTSFDPNWQWLSHRLFTKHTEFPKRKLIRYQIRRGLFRRKLVLIIDSKTGHHKKEKFMISYLRRRECMDLERSLRKVIQQNKKKDV